MQVEANSLTYGLADKVKPMELNQNRCGDDCRGYPMHMRRHLERVRTIDNDNALHPGINVLHFAFRGICGQVRDFAKWKKADVFTISRAMTEKVLIDQDAVQRCNQFDEIWVPSHQSKEVRAAAVTIGNSGLGFGSAPKQIALCVQGRSGQACRAWRRVLIPFNGCVIDRAPCTLHVLCGASGV